MVKGKTAVVAVGGGFACTYGAGILEALDKNDIVPDIVVGGSGSAGTLIYFVSKQTSIMKKLWLDIVASDEVASPKRFWKPLDVYAMLRLAKEKYPIDEKTLRNSKTKYFISTANCTTQEVEYFSNKSKTNIYDVLIASKKIPVVTGLAHHIMNGNKYYDGGFVTRREDYIWKAIKHGATRIIYIDNDFKNGLFPIYKLMWLYGLFAPKKLRQTIWRGLGNDITKPFPKGVKVEIIKPSKPLEVTLLSKDKKLLEETYNLGLKDGLKKIKMLKEFIKK